MSSVSRNNLSKGDTHLSLMTYLPPGTAFPVLAWLEFYDGKMPKSPDDPVTTQRLLARLYVEPDTMCVGPGNAIANGDASWSRVIGTNGSAVADLSVSTKEGNGWW